MLLEGAEGVKWELGLAFCCPGKMGLSALGLGFGHWEWEKMSKWEWDKYFWALGSGIWKKYGLGNGIGTHPSGPSSCNHFSIISSHLAYKMSKNTPGIKFNNCKAGHFTSWKGLERNEKGKKWKMLVCWSQFTSRIHSASQKKQNKTKQSKQTKMTPSY